MAGIKKGVKIALLTGTLAITGFLASGTRAPQAKDAASSTDSQTTIQPADYLNFPVSDFRNDLVSWLDSAFKANDLPGMAVAVVYRDSILYTGTWGYTSLKTHQPLSNDSPFRLGSLSKGVSSVLTSRLVQAGYLDWDDCVSDYLPDFRIGKYDDITIRQILSHTTGLPYHAHTSLIESKWSLEKALPYLAHVKTISKPGQLYSYQNLAYSAIQPVLEKATGKSYPDLLNEYLFQPMGMLHASCDQASMLHDSLAAQPHVHTRKGWYQRQITAKYYNAIPAGGVNASINDMAHYVKNLLGYGQLDAHEFTPIFEPFIKTPIERRYFRDWDQLNEAYYGMGWRILVNQEDTVYYHGGFVNYYRSEIAMRPCDGLGIVFLFNEFTPFAKQVVPEILRLFDPYRSTLESWPLPVATS
ncbi:MAG: serine hydrolase domain-containing protein [Saprospiraceae bacterium]